jgi:uncharacterized C2H2 Zn-finger protein
MSAGQQVPGGVAGVVGRLEATLETALHQLRREQLARKAAGRKLKEAEARRAALEQRRQLAEHALRSERTAREAAEKKLQESNTNLMNVEQGLQFAEEAFRNILIKKDERIEWLAARVLQLEGGADLKARGQQADSEELLQEDVEILREERQAEARELEDSAGFQEDGSNPARNEDEATADVSLASDGQIGEMRKKPLGTKELMEDPKSANIVARLQSMKRIPRRCAVCHGQFASHNELVRHQNDEHDDMSECKLCDKKFKNKYTLKSHEVTVHSDSKLFVCSRCGQKFNNADSWRRHQVSAVRVQCILMQWNSHLTAQTNDDLHRRLDSEQRSPFLLCRWGHCHSSKIVFPLLYNFRHM